jgi:hypothetical protein
MKKLAPPNASVVSFTPVEIQYVILMNIQYIIEKSEINIDLLNI